jgi:ABC-type multidrug transport system fused ATPase/permease subunit
MNRMRLFEELKLLRFNNSILGRSLALIEKQSQNKVVLLIVSQIVIGLFDILGIILLGLVGALAVSGVESRGPGSHVNLAIKIAHLENFSFQYQVAFLAGLAAIFLVFKSVISGYLTKRILLFLSYKGAAISGGLAEKLLSQSIVEIRQRTQQETIFALTNGVEELTLRVIGALAIACSDAALLILLGFMLFVYQPLVALSCFAFLIIIVLSLHLSVNRNAQIMGSVLGRVSIESSEKIVLAVSSFRELAVRNQIGFLVSNIKTSRLEMAESQAGLAFIPSIGKYVIETSVVLGALLLSAVQFVLTDATHAVATLTIFLAAGARVAPAILRLQQSYLTYKSNSASALRTLDLADSLNDVDSSNIGKTSEKFIDNHPEFNPSISMLDVSLTYPGANEQALRNINLSVTSGESIAIVGPSGAGKTSLVDVVLGLIKPTSGTATISGVAAVEARVISPGAMAYVPQGVVVANGTLRYNLTLGYKADRVPVEKLWDVLKLAKLDEYVKSLPDELDQMIGERGVKLSGGQQQRLVIARALLSKPKLLILDEATSALDADTELAISEAINLLKGATTVIMIAHRLSSVRKVNRVVYMDSGVIVAEGNFEAVRNLVPDFDRQAKLMGL